MFGRFCGIFAIMLFLLSPALAQDAAPSPAPVSRQEFDQLKKDNEDLRQQLTDIKRMLSEQAAKPAQPAAPAAPALAPDAAADLKQQITDIKKAQADQQASADQDAQDNDRQMKLLQDQIAHDHPGLEGLAIVGDANIGFQTQRKSDSSFFADVSPLILWQPVDSHFLVETAFDLGIGGSDVTSESTTVSLELADISYDVNDYLTIGGGLFEVPFGQYHNHFDPPWIDKFPDDPLAQDALGPISEVGFFAKGVIPSGTTRWTYDVYGANGPNLIVNDPNAAGQLDFDDFTDLNNNKAVGGRLGFLPHNDVELGYSVQYSKPSPHGFENVDALLQAVDLHWKPLVRQLGGQFDFTTEWIWSDLTTATYDPTGIDGFGPYRFNNRRDGGYASVAYRPTEFGNQVVRNFELVGRYDTLDSSTAAPGGGRESRYTIGIDYWFTPYIVAKTAYEIDDKHVGTDQNTFIFQLGVGL